LNIVETGRGAPLVFIPGLQGRWEYARLTIDALARHFRVITFSLCDEPTAAAAFERERGFDTYGDQVAAALDTARAARASVCGLSFGGLIALNFASRYPDRVESLVLASTPGPGWHLRRRHEIYARLPWLFGPVFMIEAPFRAKPEVRRALPMPRDRRAFAWTLARTALKAPLSPSRMAARARMIAGYDVEAACARITAPTLILTGEPGLDHVVHADTTSQYARLIAGAESVTLERTGHQGSLTRPDAFAAIVHGFVSGHRHAAA
jgi:3-oxoadipate enol-lactonase